ncbi:succinylglutamate desuccinylase/aspartoacylase family protein [Belliella sp. DSM 111904]|uniref:Succinylglutamate desuccinylase/aspartoacylase family protein n=1 Tax=Belliella filtrata TaxID=2923435 RepID=A0ABS9V2E7_9BACT|nr:succinylglutamate desuccinylase/aspartoacylase family protein [Belliella filtrata]MCH7410583.1 succinylglutamate desuccinylase/aspartoacylase family protein [Belliella filtrata]
MDKIIDLKKTPNSRILGQVTSCKNHSDHHDNYLIISCGIHGNEIAGLIAAEEILEELKLQSTAPELNVLFLLGNRQALKEKKRFIDKDLNRIFLIDYNKDSLPVTRQESRQDLEELNEIHEVKERDEIIKVIEELEHSVGVKGKFYYIDMHTTSSYSKPYISANVKFSQTDFLKAFELPIVLGIEKFIPGHFDHYLASRGYVGFTVEGGQHKDPNAVKILKEVLLKAIKILSKPKLIDRLGNFSKPAKISDENHPETYEVLFRFHIPEGKTFRMNPGFENFTKVVKNQVLASLDNKAVLAPISGQIFMPLYQTSGSDGFYIVHKISNE